MDTSPPPDDPLAAIFAGKRDFLRIPSGRLATVEGAGGVFAARILDLSHGGVLFAVDDPEFYAEEADGLGLVERAFPEGLEVTFLAESLRLPAAVVRITPHDEGRVALGCRFAQTLTPEEAVLLGVRAADVDHPEALMGKLPYVARPEKPVSLLLFTGESVAEAGGPRSLGRVTAVGMRVLEALVLAPTLPPSGLVQALVPLPLAAALVRGVDRLWEGPVDLFECRVLVEEPAPILRLLASEDLPPSVHARFRARR